MKLKAIAAWPVFLAVAQWMSAATPPSESFGLVAHWSFDRDFASSVNNALYAGTPHGAARLQVDRGGGVAKVGTGAARFDTAPRAGEPVYISIPHPPGGFEGADVFTLMGWFKLSDVAGDGSDPRKFVWESVPNSAVTFSINQGRRGPVAQFRFRSENYRQFTETDGPLMAAGEWHHVAVVWNSRARHVRVYYDGRLHKTLPHGDADGLEPIRGFHFGGNKLGDGAADWDGWLDDLALFDLELTARQIAAIAQGGDVSAANVLARLPEPTSQRLAAGPRELAPPPIPAHESSSQGPLIGHVSEREAVIWARVPHAGEYVVSAKPPAGRTVTATGVASATNDWCLHWRLTGLNPKTHYTLTFTPPRGTPVTLAPLTLRTAPPPEEPGKVVLGFGSCVEFPANRIWTRAADECPDGFVLLGDTPYIDTTKRDAMRWAYRRLAANTTLAAAFQRVPFWATWDDHDFGRNSADGTMPNKEVSRQVFAEYRPLPSVGENGIGTYTSFRRGAVEVFLLDTRWFARTGKSWSDPTRDTLMGTQQWEWLQRGLRASTAPFKVLACGMIWSRKGNSTESDAWGSYEYERDALFRWLGDNRISGVVLIGGDIHVSRLLRFPTRPSVGYDLTEFITSPMHDRLIPSANVPDPNLVTSAIEPWVFLKVTVDSTSSPTLLGELMNRDGKVFFRQELKASELRQRSSR